MRNLMYCPNYPSLPPKEKIIVYGVENVGYVEILQSIRF